MPDAAGAGEAGRALRGGTDTIAAIATASGRGAIALVRVSGADAFAIARRVVDPWPVDPRAATLATIRDPDSGTVVDQALVTRFEAGRSFSGEPTVEISTHGGVVTPALVLAALVAAGARQALPGEFTRRAVLSGRLTLAQAEAIGDVIDATSRAAQRVALHAADGALSAAVLALRDAVLDVEALIAYDIDFPEEDEGPVSRERVLDAAQRAIEAIDALRSTEARGHVVRDGALVVLAGVPNAGKSSLFNALLGESRALVTPVAGTTRDAIEAVLDSGAWPLRLVDTAGLRESADQVERLGIEVSGRYLANARVVLVCGESAPDLALADARVRALTNAPRIRVLTKSDRDGTRAPADALPVSALTGAGLTVLLARIVEAVEASLGELPADDAPIVTRARHAQALARAREEMEAFVAARHDDALPAPVAAVHLRSAALALEELVGAVDIDDVLDRVFRTFCVGK